MNQNFIGGVKTITKENEEIILKKFKANKKFPNKQEQLEILALKKKYF